MVRRMFRKIRGGSHETVRVLVKVPQPRVTPRTKNFSDFSCHMIVVNVRVKRILQFFPTYRTLSFLDRNHLFFLLERNSVKSFQICASLGSLILSCRIAPPSSGRICTSFAVRAKPVRLSAVFIEPAFRFFLPAFGTTFQFALN